MSKVSSLSKNLSEYTQFLKTDNSNDRLILLGEVQKQNLEEEKRLDKNSCNVSLVRDL